MNFIRKLRVAALLMLLLTMVMPQASALAARAVLKANTSIPFKLDSELSSKVNKQGDRFNITVAEDVMDGSRVLVPRGTHGVGAISRLVEKGAFGRSGKLEIELLYMVVDGRQIELTGQKNDAGSSGTAGTVAVAVVAGVFSAFVTGKSAVLPAGTTVVGYTKVDTSL